MTAKVHSVREFQEAGVDCSSKDFIWHPGILKDASLISLNPTAVGAVAHASSK